MLRRLLIATGLVVALLTTQVGTALADVTEVNATITSVTLIDPAHALVEGTVTCDAPATAYISVTLRQRGGVSGFREAYGDVGAVSCNTTPTSFSLVVTGGPLHRGSASLDAFLYAYDAFDQSAQNRLITTVTIR
jgi:hypothetical protein